MSSPRAATSKRPDIEAELRDRFHVDYTFTRRVPLDDFDRDRSLKNQARFEPLNEATVEEYKEGVERGDPFPAIVAWRPGRGAHAKLVVIDGNHRFEAHLRAGVPIDVYEIDRTTKPGLVAVMTFTFNTRHGRKTSEEERVQHALYLIKNGADQKDAAATMSVPLRLIKRALTRAVADERAKDVGVDMREWDTLIPTVKTRLVQISTDEGFYGAVHLAHIARLTQEEAYELCTLLNTSKSATKQRQILKSETERFQDKIQASGAGTYTGNNGRKTSSPKQRVSMALGQVLSLPEDFSSLAESYAEAEREESGRRILDASERLRKLALTLHPALA